MPKSNRPLIVLGAGGHAKAVLDAAVSQGYSNFRGFLADSTPREGHTSGLDHLGMIGDFRKYIDTCSFVLGIGRVGRSPERNKILNSLFSEGARLQTIVAKAAYVSPRAEVGEGSVILHGAVINAGAVIGRGCIINSQALVEHDSTVGDYSHISTGALVNGGCNIGADVFLGSGAIVFDHIRVSDRSIIPAGAVVRESV